MRHVLIMLVAFVSACAGQPATVNHYLLRADQARESRALNLSADYRFNSLVVADYIDQPGLVLETSPGEVHVARNHRWAEPLRRSLRSVLSREVSQALGQDVLFISTGPPPMGIDVHIDQLHGSHDGDAVLVAHWSVSNPDQALQVWRFSRRRPLPGDGYPTLVEQQKILLQELAQEIARSLNSMDGAAVGQ